MSIKIEDTEVFGWRKAIKGARNPLNSWEKSDSAFLCGSTYYDILNHMVNPIADYDDGTNGENIIGPNDHKLLMNLCKGGTEESKWRRMIHVQMDVTAPLYWWKEFETYKIGSVSNSCSTMHKIQAKVFTLDDFSCEHLGHYDPEKENTEQDDTGIGVDGIQAWPTDILCDLVDCLNHNRIKFLETKDKKYWYQMIQLLPTSYNQKRTIDLNYEVLASQYRQRKGHKLTEWAEYLEWIRGLPYSEFITMEENKV